MPFAEHNNVVKTIPSDRTDESLRIPVLPIPYTHCSKPLDDDIAIDAVPTLMAEAETAGVIERANAR